MSIVVKNLTKIYGTQKAVDNINFELKKGEIVGFIGPNGSGKSTTMKSICGILTPDNGEIYVSGRNVAESEIEVKKQIGYLPENNPLYLDQYVVEYLRYVAKTYKVAQVKERVNEIIELTGLSPERTKKISQLSKGYKQRVGLAQAMIHQPNILILDEPTTGLDPNQLTEIRELIKSIGKDKTVLLSTHILQEVEAICDRVIMINKGIIVTDKSTEEVRKGDVSVQTIKIEFKEKVNSTDLKSIPGTTSITEKPNNIFFIEGNTEVDLREQLFQFAMKNNYSILEMQTQTRSLEDSFKELSKK